MSWTRTGIFLLLNIFTHKLNKTIPKDERLSRCFPTHSLPPQIAARLQQLSLITLRFAVNLLCWDQTEQLPLSIMLTEEGNVMSAEFPPTCSTFQTILFNDETHTYEGV